MGILSKIVDVIKNEVKGTSSGGSSSSGGSGSSKGSGGSSVSFSGGSSSGRSSGGSSTSFVKNDYDYNGGYNFSIPKAPAKPSTPQFNSTAADYNGGYSFAAKRGVGTTGSTSTPRFGADLDYNGGKNFTIPKAKTQPSTPQFNVDSTALDYNGGKSFGGGGTIGKAVGSLFVPGKDRAKSDAETSSWADASTYGERKLAKSEKTEQQAYDAAKRDANLGRYVTLARSNVAAHNTKFDSYYSTAKEKISAAMQDALQTYGAGSGEYEGLKRLNDELEETGKMHERAVAFAERNTAYRELGNSINSVFAGVVGTPEYEAWAETGRKALETDSEYKKFWDKHDMSRAPKDIQDFMNAVYAVEGGMDGVEEKWNDYLGNNINRANAAQDVYESMLKEGTAIGRVWEASKNFLGSKGDAKDIWEEAKDTGLGHAFRGGVIGQGLGGAKQTFTDTKPDPNDKTILGGYSVNDSVDDMLRISLGEYAYDEDFNNYGAQGFTEMGLLGVTDEWYKEATKDATDFQKKLLGMAFYNSYDPETDTFDPEEARAVWESIKEQGNAVWQEINGARALPYEEASLESDRYYNYLNRTGRAVPFGLGKEGETLPAYLYRLGVTTLAQGPQAAAAAFASGVAAWITTGNPFAGGAAAAAAGRIAGGIPMAISAYGNTYREAVNEGFTDKQAAAYAAMDAGMEWLSDYTLSKMGSATGKLTGMAMDKAAASIGAPLGKALVKLGIGSMGEGLQEYFQYGVDPILRHFTLGEDMDTARGGMSWGEYLTSEEAKDSFFQGAFSSILMSAPTELTRGVINNTHMQAYGNYVLNANPTALDKLVNTIINSDLKPEKKADREAYEKAKQTAQWIKDGKIKPTALTIGEMGRDFGVAGGDTKFLADPTTAGYNKDTISTGDMAIGATSALLAIDGDVSMAADIAKMAKGETVSPERQTEINNDPKAQQVLAQLQGDFDFSDNKNALTIAARSSTMDAGEATKTHRIVKANNPDKHITTNTEQYLINNAMGPAEAGRVSEVLDKVLEGRQITRDEAKLLRLGGKNGMISYQAIVELLGIDLDMHAKVDDILKALNEKAAEMAKLADDQQGVKNENRRAASTYRVKGKPSLRNRGGNRNGRAAEDAQGNVPGGVSSAPEGSPGARLGGLGRRPGVPAAQERANRNGVIPEKNYTAEEKAIIDRVKSLFGKNASVKIVVGEASGIKRRLGPNGEIVGVDITICADSEFFTEAQLSNHEIDGHTFLLSLTEDERKEFLRAVAENVFGSDWFGIREQVERLYRDRTNKLDGKTEEQTFYIVMEEMFSFARAGQDWSQTEDPYLHVDFSRYKEAADALANEWHLEERAKEKFGPKGKADTGKAAQAFKKAEAEQKAEAPARAEQKAGKAFQKAQTEEEKARDSLGRRWVNEVNKFRDGKIELSTLRKRLNDLREEARSTLTRLGVSEDNISKFEAQLDETTKDIDLNPETKPTQQNPVSTEERVRLLPGKVRAEIKREFKALRKELNRNRQLATDPDYIQRVQDAFNHLKAALDEYVPLSEDSTDVESMISKVQATMESGEELSAEELAGIQSAIDGMTETVRAATAAVEAAEAEQSAEEFDYDHEIQKLQEERGRRIKSQYNRMKKNPQKTAESLNAQLRKIDEWYTVEKHKLDVKRDKLAGIETPARESARISSAEALGSEPITRESGEATAARLAKEAEKIRKRRANNGMTEKEALEAARQIELARVNEAETARRAENREVAEENKEKVSIMQAQIRYIMSEYENDVFDLYDSGLSIAEAKAEYRRLTAEKNAAVATINNEIRRLAPGLVDDVSTANAPFEDSENEKFSLEPLNPKDYDIHTNRREFLNEIKGGKFRGHTIGEYLAAAGVGLITPANRDIEIGNYDIFNGLEPGAFGVRYDLGRGTNVHVVFHPDEKYVYVDELFPGGYKGDGLGIMYMHNLIKWAKKMGYEKITCEAAKTWADRAGMQMNGFYTWPRLGFDQSIEGLLKNFDDRNKYFHTPENHRLLSDPRNHFGQDVKKVSDIMKTSAGRAWWKRFGCWLVHAEFDLADGSYSMQTFDNYMNYRKSIGYLGISPIAKYNLDKIEDVAPELSENYLWKQRTAVLNRIKELEDFLDNSAFEHEVESVESELRKLRSYSVQIPGLINRLINEQDSYSLEPGRGTLEEENNGRESTDVERTDRRAVGRGSQSGRDNGENVSADRGPASVGLPSGESGYDSAEQPRARVNRHGNREERRKWKSMCKVMRKKSIDSLQKKGALILEPEEVPPFAEDVEDFIRELDPNCQVTFYYSLFDRRRGFFNRGIYPGADGGVFINIAAFENFSKQGAKNRLIYMLSQSQMVLTTAAHEMGHRYVYYAAVDRGVSVEEMSWSGLQYLADRLAGENRADVLYGLADVFDYYRKHLPGYKSDDAIVQEVLSEFFAKASRNFPDKNVFSVCRPVVMQWFEENTDYGKLTEEEQDMFSLEPGSDLDEDISTEELMDRTGEYYGNENEQAIWQDSTGGINELSRLAVDSNQISEEEIIDQIAALDPDDPNNEAQLASLYEQLLAAQNEGFNETKATLEEKAKAAEPEKPKESKRKAKRVIPKAEPKPAPATVAEQKTTKQVIPKAKPEPEKKDGARLVGDVASLARDWGFEGKTCGWVLAELSAKEFDMQTFAGKQLEELAVEYAAGKLTDDEYETRRWGVSDYANTFLEDSAWLKDKITSVAEKYGYNTIPQLEDNVTSMEDVQRRQAAAKATEAALNDMEAYAESASWATSLAPYLSGTGRNLNWDNLTELSSAVEGKDNVVSFAKIQKTAPATVAEPKAAPVQEAAFDVPHSDVDGPFDLSGKTVSEAMNDIRSKLSRLRKNANQSAETQQLINGLSEQYEKLKAQVSEKEDYQKVIGPSGKEAAVAPKAESKAEKQKTATKNAFASKETKEKKADGKKSKAETAPISETPAKIERPKMKRGDNPVDVKNLSKKKAIEKVTTERTQFEQWYRQETEALAAQKLSDEKYAKEYAKLTNAYNKALQRYNKQLQFLNGIEEVVKEKATVVKDEDTVYTSKTGEWWKRIANAHTVEIRRRRSDRNAYDVRFTDSKGNTYVFDEVSPSRLEMALGEKLGKRTVAKERLASPYESAAKNLGEWFSVDNTKFDSKAKTKSELEHEKDSFGKNVTFRMAAYMAKSKVRDASGRLIRLYKLGDRYGINSDPNVPYDVWSEKPSTMNLLRGMDGATAYDQEGKRSGKKIAELLQELAEHPQYTEQHKNAIRDQIAALEQKNREYVNHVTRLDSNRPEYQNPNRADISGGKSLLECFVDIRSPLVIDAKGASLAYVYDQAQKLLDDPENQTGRTSPNGDPIGAYDGIKITNVKVTEKGQTLGGGKLDTDTIYITFRPNQGKSTYNTAPSESDLVAYSLEPNREATWDADWEYNMFYQYGGKTVKEAYRIFSNKRTEVDNTLADELDYLEWQARNGRISSAEYQRQYNKSVNKFQTEMKMLDDVEDKLGRYRAKYGDRAVIDPNGFDEEKNRRWGDYYDTENEKFSVEPGSADVSDIYPEGTLQHAVLSAIRDKDYDHAIETLANYLSQFYQTGVLPKLEDEKSRNIFNPRMSAAEQEVWRMKAEELVKKYGGLEQGENPARDVAFPKKTEQGNIRRVFRTAAESKHTPERAVPLITRESMIGEGATYQTITDKSAIAAASRDMSKKGFDRVLAEWEAKADGDIGANTITKYDIAKAEMLYIEAVKVGDMDIAMRVLAELAEVGTSAGQTVQAMRMLKTMPKSYQLYYMQRVVNRLNRQFAKRINSGRMSELVLNGDLVRAVMRAQTQEEIDSAMEALLQDVANQIPANFADKWNAWRYLAMLGNPKTHIRNILGNGIFAPVVFAKDLVAAGLETTFIHDRSKRRTSVKGILAGTLGSAKHNEYKAFAANDFEGIKKELQSGGKLNPSNEILDLRTIFKSKLLEKMRKANGEFLEGEDGAFLKLHYIAAMTNFLVTQGVSVEKLNDPNFKEGRKILNAARAYAFNEAQKATYRDANRVASALNQMKRNSGLAGNVLLEGMLPFTKTPLNILRRGVEYSPIGLLLTATSGLGKLRRGEMTSSEFIDSFAAGMTGTGIAVLGFWLASLGLLKGGDDDDDKKEDFETLQGYQDYSINFSVGGKDYNYTIDWMAPGSLPLFVGSALFNELKDDNGELSKADWLNAMTVIAEPITQLSMLSGLNDALKSAKWDDNPVSALAETMASGYVTQALPTLLAQISRSMVADRRTTYVDKNSDTPDAIQRWWQTNVLGKTPLNAQRTEYIDAWGRKDTKPNFVFRLLENMISPGYLNRVKTTPVDEELSRLAEEVGTGVLMTVPERSIEFDHETHHLTAEQYQLYAKTRGDQAMTMLDELFNSSGYAAMSDEDKAYAVDLIKDYANILGKQAVFPEYDSNADNWAEKCDGDPTRITNTALFRARAKSAGVNINTTAAFDFITQQSWLSPVDQAYQIAQLHNLSSTKYVYYRRKKYAIEKGDKDAISEQYRKIFPAYYLELVQSDKWKNANEEKRTKLLSDCRADANADAKGWLAYLYYEAGRPTV